MLRSVVLARAWARLPGVEVLSGRDGGPLTRTIKKIIDPLVVRTSVRARLGKPVLDAEEAAELTALVVADAERLRATAAWFTRLKRQRRALRITAGDVQDVCFPLAYELATGFGMPGADADQTAADALRDLHGEAGDAAVDRLAAYLADQQVAAELTAELRERWLAVGEPAGDPAALAEFVETLTDAAWRKLADSGAGHALGVSLRRAGGVGELERVIHEICGMDTPELGLQRGEVTTIPPLDRGGEIGAELLERSVERRVRATVRRLPADERDQPVAGLVDEELSRCVAGFGLGESVLATCFALGVVLAPALRPLDGASPDGVPEFARRLNAQVAREGYVLHARRALAGSTPLTPRPDDHVVRELREFAKQFLGRLWIRLHGFDVRGEWPSDAAEVRALVTGVVRSASLDLRTKVRRSLMARLPELEVAS
ncbi:hypothetical protein SAMN05421504_101670 [Amycolatopsis xylanica]|uniref:Uncharacterized protein n=1 Tax=Amycolatopsis xylanica TaxID=589385 RepID=A0A1H2TUN0_9PSEU|nr:hypothetical protein [Amycolatopsis xylanica]SDW46904.1 hypothetical protein SAMN05421504_101670 [Amycolatopsis xylanica]